MIECDKSIYTFTFILRLINLNPIFFPLHENQLETRSRFSVFRDPLIVMMEVYIFS